MGPPWTQQPPASPRGAPNSTPPRLHLGGPGPGLPSRVPSSASRRSASGPFLGGTVQRGPATPCIMRGFGTAEGGRDALHGFGAQGPALGCQGPLGSNVASGSPVRGGTCGSSLGGLGPAGHGLDRGSGHDRICSCGNTLCYDSLYCRKCGQEWTQEAPGSGYACAGVGTPPRAVSQVVPPQLAHDAVRYLCEFIAHEEERHGLTPRGAAGCATGVPSAAAATAAGVAAARAASGAAAGIGGLAF